MQWRDTYIAVSKECRKVRGPDVVHKSDELGHKEGIAGRLDSSRVKTVLVQLLTQSSPQLVGRDIYSGQLSN